MHIVFQKVSKHFPGRSGGASVLALDEIDLTIDQGEFVVLLGPSGCGKTTLLKMLGGFDKPTSGKILMRGVETSAPGPDRGVIFQAPTLFPWLTATDNVIYGPKVQGQDLTQARDRAAEILRSVGLTGFENFRPHNLSGGMQQRVAIARVLINEPEVILADEPFAALDEYTRRAMQVMFAAIVGQFGRSMLFVTHSVEEAVFLADRVVVMTPRPGRIRKIVEVPLARPRDRKSTAFLSVMGEMLGLIEHDIFAGAA